MAMTNPAPVSRRSRGPRLGEMLLARGLISEDDLDEALETQQRTGERLGNLLVNAGVVTEVDLVRVLAEHFGLEFVDLDDRPIDPSVVQRVKESFARYHQLLPFGWDEENGVLLVAMVNPTNVFSLDDVRTVAGCEIKPFMAEQTQLLRAIDRIWNADATDETVLKLEQEHRADIDEEVFGAASAEDAPVIQFVNQIITRAVQERASDIHFDPMQRELKVRFRIDGVLHEVMTVPRSAAASLISRVKIMAEINIAERRVPQDGRMSLTVSNRPVSLRVVTLPTAYGEAAIVRVLEETTGVFDLAELGFRPDALRVFDAAIHRPWGAILATGPTGSGKTTTLYAAVAALNDPSRNLITVEDPIEYRLQGVKQLQVNRKAGLTFASALRSILRADPDVVFVGEIRDVETARIATEAALTGHLVLSTLHTNDTASTPHRLIDMGVEPFLLTSAINCVVAQRLARRLCERCKEPQKVTVDELAEPGVKEIIERNSKIFSPVGCRACSNTGYYGRVAVTEVMAVSEEIGHLIATSAPPSQIHAAAVENGMVPLRSDGLYKVVEGQTSLAEVLRAVG
jgi:type IV pilus assembly protein PilB